MADAREMLCEYKKCSTRQRVENRYNERNMPRIPPRSLLIIFLAVLGGFCLLAGAVFMILQLSLPPDIAELVPAEKTIALIRHASSKDLQALRSDLPALNSVPSLPDNTRMNVAVMEGMIPQSPQWILVPDDPRAASLLSSHQPTTVRGVTLIASSQAAINQLLIDPKDERSLALGDDYQKLIDGYEDGEKPSSLQIYLANQHPNQETGILDQWLAALITTDPTSFAIRLTQKGERLVPQASLPPTLLLPSPLPSLTVSLANAASLETFLAPLSPDRATPLRATMLHSFAAFLGTNVSVDYDLLPLIQKETTLHIGPSQGTGALSLLLTGNAADPTIDVAARVAALRDRLQSQHVPVAIDHRTFEGEYESTIVREGSAQSARGEEEYGGWQIFPLGTLTLAVRSDGIMIGNHPAWQEQLIKENADVTPLPSTHTQRIAAGLVTREWADSFRKLLNPLPLPSLMQRFMNGSSPLLWSIGTDAHVTEVTLQK